MSGTHSMMNGSNQANCRKTNLRVFLVASPNEMRISVWNFHNILIKKGCIVLITIVTYVN